MSILMPSTVFKFPGQVVSEVAFAAPSNQLIFTCLRDRRRKVFDPETGQSGTINRYVRRRIKDIPLLGCYSIIEIELAEIRLANGIRRIEEVCFVEKGCYYTKRFCKLMSGLCRHMTIQSIAKHFHLRWAYS